MSTTPLKEELLKMTLTASLAALKNKSIKASEFTQAYLDRIEETQGLNAYVTVTREKALAQAKESDHHWEKGTQRPLEGLPIALKDAYCTKGIRTTASSKMLANFVPEYESTLGEKMAQAGAVLLGKTNLDEFCMGSATTPQYTGSTLNPWNPERSAGGSSGGSAAAVASGSALAALGTDTGGSVRQPASFCGVVGVKPTYGLCSRWGIVAFASSLDCPGPFTRTVEDAALLLETMAGHDPKESTSLKKTVIPGEYTSQVGKSVKGLKIGIPKEWQEQAMLDEDIALMWINAQKIYQDAGCEVVPVSLPYSQYALPCYYILACAEAASNLQRYDGVKYGFRTKAENLESLEEMYCLTRGEGFGPEVKRRILTGTYVLSHGYYDAFYAKALDMRRRIEQDFHKTFEQVDVLLTPTTPTQAFSLKALPTDPVSMYWNDVLTVPVNIGNACAISVPGALSRDRLPLGMQIIAPGLQEGRLFQFGHILEQEIGLYKELRLSDAFDRSPQHTPFSDPSLTFFSAGA